MAPAREEGHPVDGDGHGAMLVVKVMHMMGGAEAGGDAGGDGHAREGQQRQPQQQAPHA